MDLMPTQASAVVRQRQPGSSPVVASEAPTADLGGADLSQWRTWEVPFESDAGLSIHNWRAPFEDSADL